MARQGRAPLTRRQFLWGLAGTASLAAGSGAVVGYTTCLEPEWLEVVRRDLPINRLPEALVGRTLVQISDLHVGPIVDDAYLRRVLRHVATLEPDILAITGDFMTCAAGEQLDHTFRVLQHLRPARLGTVAVLGNHDYAGGWRDEAVADRLTSRLRGLGVAVLRNASVDVRGLTIAGIDDLFSPRFDPARVLPTLTPDRAAIVLCHNPDAADRPVWSGYRGWVLCGHTHGWEGRLPFCSSPPPVRNLRYIAGEVNLEDGRRLYVNRGIGYHQPLRFRDRPEITVFTLRRQSEAGVA